MRDFREQLENNIIITDGAFGTYFSRTYDTNELPESFNVTEPEKVIAIHKEYIEAGAKLIRTNTFASNTVNLYEDIDAVKRNVVAAVNNAKMATSDREVYIAADIGPIPNENMFDAKLIQNEYVELVKTFLDEGIKIFVFETFSDMSLIEEAIEYIGDRAFVIVQFMVNQFGYSNAGLSARKLVEIADKNKNVDALGFNCGVGPGHLCSILEKIVGYTGKCITALPNAGYPQVVSGRMVFTDKNMDYFADKLVDIASAGASIIGGCCGTTPEYIKLATQKLSACKVEKRALEEGNDKEAECIRDNAFYKDKEGKKLIAVELAPPVGSDDEKLMEAAFLMKEAGVDVVTFPDSPSGRTRADSVLQALKVKRETGLTVMPHICCRDKNAIAMRSQMLGAHLNDINNFLVITGDPIPSAIRSSVKSVFNFNSVGLMNIIGDMNEDQFKGSPMIYGGAINQGRLNLELEIDRCKKKMEAGATFFMTQPVFGMEDVSRLKRIKEETGARILCGIMPLVSLKNARFMKNEMTGINVPDEVLERYHEDMSKEEGEAVGIGVAREVIANTDFLDGYYFSFPFNRVYLLNKILN